MALMGIFAILNMKQETWLTTLGFWANIKIVLLVSKEDFLILDMKQETWLTTLGFWVIMRFAYFGSIAYGFEVTKSEFFSPALLCST